MPNKRVIFQLDDMVRVTFKAAGVLVCGVDEVGEWWVLLGKEERTRQRGISEKEFWLHFSGKREPKDGDDPRATAMRELDEESGGVCAEFSSIIARQLYCDTLPKLWDEQSKYVLFCVTLPSLPRAWPDEFQRRRNDPNSQHAFRETWQQELAWVSTRDIWLNDQHPKPSFIYHENRKRWEVMYPFLVILLRNKEVHHIMRFVQCQQTDESPEWKMRRHSASF